LRSKGNGWIEQGEESNDLGIENDGVESALQKQPSSSNNRENGMTIAQGQEQRKGECLHVAPLPGAAPAQGRSQHPNQDIHALFQPTAAPQLNQEQYRQEQQPWQQQFQADFVSSPTSQQANLLVTERLTLDACYPFFDRTMLDLFPNGEMPDLSQFEANFMTLDYLKLEGCNNGSHPSEES
jgi:hypothetical protein